MRQVDGRYWEFMDRMWTDVLVVLIVLVLLLLTWLVVLRRRLRHSEQALEAGNARREQIERSARDSELKFLALSDALPQALWTVGPEGLPLHMNRRWAEYTGLSQEECQGDGWLATVHPDDVKGYLDARDTALRTGTESSDEVRLRRHDGEFRWWLVRVVPGRDPQGRIIEWIGSCTDIDDLKQAEERARSSEDRYRQILETTPDVVLLVDATDRIRYVNGAVAAIFGHAPESLLGQSMSLLQPERLRAAHQAGKQRYIATGVRHINWQSTHTTGLHRDGREFPVEVSFAEIQVGGERLFAGFLRDTSARRRAETLRDSLELQLRESQKMQAIGTLAGGVAHDFNNMLGVILGNLQLATEQAGANAALQGSLEEIRSASNRARSLVRQILTFSRRQPAERRVCELASIVSDSMRLLRSTLPAQVELDLTCAPDVPPVLADPQQIEQVVLNLCTNAAYAIGSGKGRVLLQIDAVRIGTQPDPDKPDLHPGRYLRLRCSDSGQGMDSATLQRVFEPFFTTKPVGMGSGLGLSVVHGIMAAHDGAITAQSEPGGGSCFTLYLPAAETDAPGVIAAVSDTRPAFPREGGGSRVLYVDDEEALVFLVRRLLERRGYSVSAYTDPEAAVAAFRAAPADYDVLVTDFNMPRLSGLDLARMVRELRPDMPIAIASGYVTQELRDQAGPAGVHELIYKEDLVERFCDGIERMISQRVN